MCQSYSKPKVGRFLRHGIKHEYNENYGFCLARTVSNACMLHFS